MLSLAQFDEEMWERLRVSPSRDNVARHIEADGSEPCDMRIVDQLLEELRYRELSSPRRAVAAWALGRLYLHERQRHFVAGAMVRALSPQKPRRKRRDGIWPPLVWGFCGVVCLLGLGLTFTIPELGFGLIDWALQGTPERETPEAIDRDTECRVAILISLGRLLPPTAWSLLLPYTSDRDSEVADAAQVGLKCILSRVSDLRSLEVDRLSINRLCHLLPRAHTGLAILLIRLLERVNDRQIDHVLMKQAQLPHESPVRAAAREAVERRRAMKRSATLLRPSMPPGTALLRAAYATPQTRADELLRGSQPVAGSD